jgi:hypothetical protein
MQPSSKPRGLLIFGAVLLGLIVIDVLSGLPVPRSIEPWISETVIAIFIAAPVMGLYAAAADTWTAKRAAILLVGGILVQFGFYMLLHPVNSVPAAVLMRIIAGISQAGLLTWCLGLGALLATLLKDKNMLLPVALFLAAFDVFVILTPGGPTAQIMRSHPGFFKSVAVAIPAVGTGMVEPSAAVAARIGPADIFLIGMFFVTLFRFGMKPKATMRALIPTLIGYMAIVMLFGDRHLGPIRLDALPALLPIGIVIIIVNRKEFKMSKQEWASTGLVAAMGVGLIAFGATRHRPEGPRELRFAPSRRLRDRALPGSGGMPEQVDRDQLPSQNPSAPTNTPNLQ